MHSVGLPDNLNLPDPRSTRAHKLKLSMCLGLAHMFTHCISGYPSFLAMAIEISCDWGAFSIIVFSVFAVSASVLTACNSPSICPLHHCQIMACSTGEGRVQCRKWKSEQQPFFVKAVIHLSLLRAEVEKSNVLRRNDGWERKGRVEGGGRDEKAGKKERAKGNWSINRHKEDLYRGEQKINKIFWRDHLFLGCPRLAHYSNTLNTHRWPLLLLTHTLWHLRTFPEHMSFVSCQWAQAVLLILSSLILFTVMCRPTQRSRGCCGKHDSHKHLHILYVLHMLAKHEHDTGCLVYREYRNIARLYPILTWLDTVLLFFFQIFWN